MFLTIDVDDGKIRLQGDETTMKVIIEAARRDLSAMSMAAGANNDTKNLYARYNALLRATAVDIARADLRAVEAPPPAVAELDPWSDQPAEEDPWA